MTLRNAFESANLASTGIFTGTFMMKWIFASAAVPDLRSRRCGLFSRRDAAVPNFGMDSKVAGSPASHERGTDR